MTLPSPLVSSADSTWSALTLLLVLVLLAVRPVPLVLVEGVTAAVAFAAFVAGFCVLFARAQLLTVHRLVLPQRSKAKFHATTVLRTEL